MRNRSNRPRLFPRLIVGRVECLPEEGSALLRVLFQAAPDWETWEAPGDPRDPESLCEADGTVQWDRPPRDQLHEGGYWVLELRPLPFQTTAIAQRRWKVGECYGPLAEIIMHSNTESELMTRLSSIGINLRSSPTGPVIFMAESDSVRGLGPIELQPMEESGQWWAPDLEGTLPKTKLWRQPIVVRLDEQDRYVVPPGTRISKRHASPSRTESSENIRTTVAQEQEEESQQTMAVASDERTTSGVESSPDVAALIANSPAMRRLVKEQILSALEKRASLETSELREATADLRSELASILEERSAQTDLLRAAGGDLQNLQANISGAAASVNALIDEAQSSLEAVAGERLREFEAKLLEATIAILESAFVSAAERSTKLAIATLAPAPQRELVATPVSSRQARSPFAELSAKPDILNVNDARDKTIASAGKRGVSPPQVWRTLTTLATGMVPLLVGSHALPVLEVIADTLCGGDLIVVPAHPAMLEPSDLFGRVSPSGDRVIFSNALLDALVTAESRNRPALVVIENANLGPMESYLMPVVDAARRPGDRRLSLFHHSLFSEGDDYGVAANLSWPSLVLVACTLSESATAIPLPRDHWGTFGLVECRGETSPSQRPKTRQAMDSGTLTRLRPMPDAELDSLEKILKLKVPLSALSSEIRHAAEVLAAVGYDLAPNQEEYDDRLLVAEGILGPWLIENDALSTFDAISADMKLSPNRAAAMRRLLGKSAP